VLKGSTSKARSGVLVVPYKAVAREMICDLRVVNVCAGDDILNEGSDLGLGFG
jgi:hypothetical protein